MSFAELTGRLRAFGRGEKGVIDAVLHSYVATCKGLREAEVRAERAEVRAAFLDETLVDVLPRLARCRDALREIADPRTGDARRQEIAAALLASGTA